MTKSRTPISTVGLSIPAVDFGCMFECFGFSRCVLVGWFGRQGLVFWLVCLVVF